MTIDLDPTPTLTVAILGCARFRLHRRRLRQLHDPANPVGLGPSSALTGLAFSPSSVAAAYAGRAFVTRWNGQSGLVNGELDCRDVVLVDPANGDVERVVSGFNATIDIVGDTHGNLLVLSYYASIWRIPSIAEPIPVFTWGERWSPLLLSAVLFTLFIASAFALPRKTRGRI